MNQTLRWNIELFIQSKLSNCLNCVILKSNSRRNKGNSNFYKLKHIAGVKKKKTKWENEIIDDVHIVYL